MCNKNHVHNLKNCSFTQKGENHLNLSSAAAFLMQQSRTMPLQKNAWKNCIFFCLGPLLHCIPKLSSKLPQKSLIFQITSNYIFCPYNHKNETFRPFSDTLDTTSKSWSNELDPCTVFWQTRQNFMTSQKDTFFQILDFVGGQTIRRKS